MTTSIKTWKQNRGAGILIVLAAFALMAMLGLSLYHYKVFERNLQNETSFRDSLQASYAAEYVFQESLKFIEEGFKTNRGASTFNNVQVVALPVEDCQVQDGVAPGCFRVSQSLEISAADREANPGLPEHAVFFVLCHGNCGLNPSYRGVSRINARVAVFKDGSVETWEYVALAAKGSVFSPGYYHGGEFGGNEFEVPTYYGGARRLTRAAIHKLKEKCAAGKSAYEAMIKKYFTTKVCSEASVENLREAGVTEKEVLLVDEDELKTDVKLQSRVLANVLNYKENLPSLATEVYDAIGYASPKQAETALKAMDDQTFITTVYETELQNFLSAASLKLKKKSSPPKSSGKSGDSSGGLGTGGLGGELGDGSSGGDPEYEYEDELAQYIEDYLDLNRDLSSLSKSNVNVKEVIYELPEELRYENLCKPTSTYPEYANIESEVDSWVDDIKISDTANVAKIDCGSSCSVEIDCVSNSHVVKLIKGNGTVETRLISERDAVIYSAQAMTITKAYYCSSEEAKPVTFVSDENIVVESPVLTKEWIGKEDSSLTKAHLYKLDKEHSNKLAFISKKDVVLDTTKMRALELNDDTLQLSAEPVAGIDINESSTKWGGWIDANIAARGAVRITSSSIASIPVTISGAIAAKRINSHLLTSSSGSCKQVGSQIVLNPKAVRPGKGPYAPSLEGAVDIEVVMIKRGNSDRDFAHNN